MNKDITIQYQKIDINGDWFLFRPIGVIRGTFLEDEELFESEGGLILYNINGYNPDMEFYYSIPTTIDELKKYYGKTSEDALINQFFLIALDDCLLGFFEGDRIKTARVSFDDIESLLTGEKDLLTLNQTQTEDGFVFSEKDLTDLRKLETLKEVRKRLDDLIRISKNSKKTYKEEEKKLTLKPKESKQFNYKKLKKVVLSNIIAQDKAVEDVTTGIAINYKSKNPRHKSHILIAGPSGTGKTEMMNVITKELGVPCFKADATAYTKEGYVGKSVYSMISGLIEAADGDIEKAQNGILIIDEIDKKASGRKDDVGGQSVLNSLLKIMDRGIIEVNKDYYYSQSFDTSNLTIIFMGAFTDLYENKCKNQKTLNIGFGSSVSAPKDIKVDELSEQDFIEYGMPSEFMGRIGIITHTKQFSIENLIEILKKSKISPLKIEQEFFEELGVKLTYTSGYIKQVALKSQKSKLGARDLKKIVKETLKYVYEAVLLDNKIKEIKLTKETVDNPKKYYIK